MSIKWYPLLVLICIFIIITEVVSIHVFVGLLKSFIFEFHVHTYYPFLCPHLFLGVMYVMQRLKIALCNKYLQILYPQFTLSSLLG